MSTRISRSTTSPAYQVPASHAVSAYTSMAARTHAVGTQAPPDLQSLFYTIYPATASTLIYVDPAGNDGNSGTTGSPKLTLQGAINAASAGNRIIVRAGTYAGATFSGKNGTTSNWIQMVGLAGAKVQGAGQGEGIISFNGSTFCAVYGLEVIGLNASGGGNQYELGFYIDGTGHSCAVWKCHIHHCSGHAFAANNGSRCDVMYNDCHDLAHYNEYQASAISLIGMPNGGGRIAWGDGYMNRIVGNTGDGIWGEEAYMGGGITDGNFIIIDQSSGYTGRTLITRNLSVGCGGRGIHTLIGDHVDAWCNTSVDCIQNLPGTWVGEFSIQDSTDDRFAWNLGAAKVGSNRVGNFQNPGTGTWSDTVFLRGTGGSQSNDPAVGAYNNVDKTSVGPSTYFVNYQQGQYKARSITDVAGFRPKSAQVAKFTVPSDVRAAVGSWPDALGYLPPASGQWAYGAFEA